MAEPAADLPWPAGHVAQAVHDDCPAELVNVPEAHAAHTRSDDGVAALLVYCPAGHGLRTTPHAAPLSSPEYVEPTAHGVQTRFAVAEPAADMPKPAPHVRHFAHASLPEKALKAPAAHAVHVRSLDSVAALFMYSPAAHAPRICAHAAPPAEAENVAPSTHAPHWRSAVSEPAADSPWPAGHVRHAAHAWLPAVALNSPPSHVAHSRSDDAPGALVSYLPAAHTVMAAHVRSAVPDGGTDVYWPCGQLALCVLHVRSRISVGVLVSYSPAPHVVTVAHSSPLIASENVASCVQAAH